MGKQILKFELSPKDVQIKKILNKEFLELDIYAISDIYPNRNDSHFTIESMNKALHTFHNKPILGYFNNLTNDFEQHNGDTKYDSELENTYWDCNAMDGERVLGVIRESDDVSIINEGGTNWIKVSCVLWTQYSYKQVKRLLKSSSKKVSVEISVEDYHYDEDGIMIIDDFTLSGITILGDKITEGIQGAHLNVLDFMRNDLYTKKVQCLSFAYSKNNENDMNVDESTLYNNLKLEENDMDMTYQANEEVLSNSLDEPALENESETVESTETFADDTSATEEVATEEAVAEDTETFADEKECGTFEDDKDPEESDDAKCAASEDQDVDDNDEGDGECKMADEDDDDLCPDCGKPIDDCICSAKEAEGCGEDEDQKECGIFEENTPSEKVIEFVEVDGEQKNIEELFAMYNELKDDMAAKKFSIEVDGVEYDIDGLYEKYTALNEEYATLKEKVELSEKEKICNTGIMMAEEETDLASEDRDAIKAKCQDGKYNSVDEIEDDIARFIYQRRKSNRAKNFKSNIVTNSQNSEDSDKKVTVFDKLKNYYN